MPSPHLRLGLAACLAHCRADILPTTAVYAALCQLREGRRYLLEALTQMALVLGVAEFQNVLS